MAMIEIDPEMVLSIIESKIDDLEEIKSHYPHVYYCGSCPSLENLNTIKDLCEIAITNGTKVFLNGTDIKDIGKDEFL